MTANVMPKFDLSGMTLKDDAALADALKTAGSSGDRFFKPGLHEVTVLSSEYKGESSDATWGKVRVEYEGVGGKTISDLLLVPFKDIGTYTDKNGKNTTVPARRIKNFLESIGATVTIKTLGETLKTYFAKDNSLTGLNVVIEVGYKGNHTKYVGKTPDGTNQIILVNKRGDQLAGTPTFTDYKDVNTYTEANSIPMARFVDVLGYKASSTPNARPKTDW